MSGIAAPVIEPGAFVAPNAIVRGAVRIGAGAVVLFGAVLRAEEDQVEVGPETNIQDNVVVHCDTGFPARIGARTTVGHSAVVHGAEVGDECLVGIGALALNGSVLEQGAWLAAGSVLPEGRRIPAWTLAVGTPARPLRELTADEIERQRSGMQTYLRLRDLYAKEER
ncbi:MAG TPA: gamma carbonic anhydrase family protein [Acidimicrobiia bacterium]|nr:gamma carbonic anhydrase family protein [Acidimicrobiia bacterium]